MEAVVRTSYLIASEISMFVLHHNFTTQPIFCTFRDKKKGYPKAVQFLTENS
ncbi:hypothetical protein VCRA2119O147_890025 [Vibrio crassostreae]|nr:hypothetical protein VCRA2116O234_130114 [Vibrio crassostreae]CAK1769948.1 hypothetical protein VCRA2113O204_150021 [Vibrio crassostreae]CAK1770504.1 hypothetical protein VCRA2113O138_150040 [Vibrio crassostreae]CAK1770530.1 hypothetical protein VCRA2110O180_150021 [Vibrio crassostreae]CAK1771394.1 hypothetical protein VCRA2110O177_150021 [Vibrio crassostreae]